MHEDPALLGCVAFSSASDVHLVLAFVECELVLVSASEHPESHFSYGVLEQLKAKLVSRYP